MAIVAIMSIAMFGRAHAIIAVDDFSGVLRTVPAVVEFVKAAPPAMGYVMWEYGTLSAVFEDDSEEPAFETEEDDFDAVSRLERFVDIKPESYPEIINRRREAAETAKLSSGLMGEILRRAHYRLLRAESEPRGDPYINLTTYRVTGGDRPEVLALLRWTGDLTLANVIGVAAGQSWQAWAQVAAARRVLDMLRPKVIKVAGDMRAREKEL